MHLGPGDDGFADVAPVRAALGDRLIGLSCGTVDEARAAGAADADYLGVGSVFATASKADAGEPIGIDGLRASPAATPLPVAAIGGIDAINLADVRAQRRRDGGRHLGDRERADPARAARRLVRAWNETTGV